MYIRHCGSHLSYLEDAPPSAAEAKLSADVWPIERLMLFLSFLLGIDVSKHIAVMFVCRYYEFKNHFCC